MPVDSGSDERQTPEFDRHDPADEAGSAGPSIAIHARHDRPTTEQLLTLHTNDKTYHGTIADRLAALLPAGWTGGGLTNIETWQSDRNWSDLVIPAVLSHGEFNPFNANSHSWWKEFSNHEGERPNDTADHSRHSQGPETSLDGPSEDGGESHHSTSDAVSSPAPATQQTASAASPLTVTTDKADYAPGSTATFTVDGVSIGGSVSFVIVDDPSKPGLNGQVDSYAPFSVTDGGSGDTDGIANGQVKALWSVPADGSATGATLSLTATSGGHTASTTFTDAPNRIALENQKAGTPQTYWNADQSNQIEGFTTDISINAGNAVNFKINVNGTQAQTLPYKIEIFRLGYYGGDGAHLVATVNNADGTVQPHPLYDATLGMKDAGNWSVTDSWQIPADAVSGVYLARLQRVDSNGNAIAGATNQIPFIVRNDGVATDIVLQTSDTSWQAYNGWWDNNGVAGANFYGDASGTVTHPPVADPGINQNRAYALSYNRPFITANGTSPASGAQDYLFGADFAAIYWLEQNGYDVSYMSGVDTSRLGTSWFADPAGNNIHKAYISVGHDEYWSGEQRANVEAARDAGVNLLFWSGNEVYWKTRWAPSIDGTTTDYRTLVSYKETWANVDPVALPSAYANIDPSNQWTGTWRDLRFVDSVDANGNHIATGAVPESLLTGQFFGPDGTGEFGGALDVPASYAGLRYWRGTTVANANGTLDIAPGIIGYEWDVAAADPYRPAGLIKLSETTLNWSGILVDQGNKVAPGTATHNLTIYRASSGALVFGAGTTFWTWGLSNAHDTQPYGGDLANTALQQFTVNMFADMGIQPQTLQASLALATASNDHAAAHATMQDLPAQTRALQPITISGTATDNDGNAATPDGVVALVEVSVDGGATWRAAQGTTNWTYQWTPTQVGTFTVMARAIDDSLNLPTAASLQSDVVTVTTPTSVGLFSTVQNVTGILSNDNAPIELGMKFQATLDGTITALRYYRAAGDAADTDVRTGHLWDANGNLLATVTFNSAPGATGWQVAQLSNPVSITANTTYVASYRTDNNYWSLPNYFDKAASEPFGDLTAPASGFPNGAGTGGNGLYTYNMASPFPTSTYKNANYWVDVSFTPTAPTTLIDVNSAANGVNENAPVGTLVGITAINSDGTTNVYSLTNNPGGRFAIDSATGVVSVAGPIDRETVGPTSSIEVTATSSTGSQKVSFSIAIADVNEFSATVPVDVNNSANGVPRGSLAGTPVGVTLSSTDADATTNGITYSLTDNAGGRFAIGATTGIVTVADASLIDTVTTHQITAKATSADGSFATATYAIPVTNDPVALSLFNRQAAPASSLYNDNASLELGVKFQSSQSGMISALSYYRAVADSTDTDVRTGHLWDANGNLLATVTFTSAPGASGWQIAALSNPVAITADTIYVASYHTENNYIATGGFFATPYTGAFGTLSAPGGTTTNGVYVYTSATVMPSNSFQSTNYWVDVSFSAATQSGVSVTAALAVDTGLSGDHITSNAALAGTTIPSGVVQFTIDGVALAATATADAVTGAWTFNPSGLAQGAHSVVANVTGAGGATGSAALSFTYDTIAPIASITTADSIISSASQVVQGTGEVGATVSVFEGSTAAGPNAVVDATGHWSTTVTMAAGGAHSITAQSTDVAGNVGALSNAVTFTFNSPPVLSGGDTASLSIAENTSAVTTLTATDPNAGQTLTYTISGGVDASLFQILNGNELSFKSAPDFETPLDSGTNNVYDVIVQVSDGAGGIDTQAIGVTVTDVPGVVQTLNVATLTGTIEPDTLTGGSLANTINGLAGNDILSGLGANDTLNGGDGDDLLIGGAGNDSIDGGAGIDTAQFSGSVRDYSFTFGATGTSIADLRTGTPDGTDSVTATTEQVQFSEGVFNFVRGTNAADGALTGTAVADLIVGFNGADSLSGGAGNDVLVGGAGRDTMTGGTGNDTFTFKLTSDSGATSTTRDIITDFTPTSVNASAHDMIDLSAIDSNTLFSGNQSFNWGGSTPTLFGVWAVQSGTGASAITTVSGDVNGDLVADFQIQLTGRMTLSQTDFFL